MRAPLLIAALLLPLPALAQKTPKAKREKVPIDRLAKPTRKATAKITADPTVDTALPLRTLKSRPRIYRAMLRNLPLASRWLKALGKGNYTITDLPKKPPISDRFAIDDNAGAKAECDIALEEPGLLVVLARGRLEVPVLPRITGSGVILVRYRKTTVEERVLTTDAQGKEQVTTVRKPALETRAQVDFRVHNQLMHALGKTFRVALVGVLKAKLEKLVGAAIHLAQEVHLRPRAVYKQLKAGNASKADLLAFKKKFLYF